MHVSIIAETPGSSQEMMHGRIGHLCILMLESISLLMVRWEKKGTTEDEMVGWHHRLDGHKFEQAPGIGDGQGSLACGSPWGHKESDTTERLN